MGIPIKNQEEIEKMRIAGKLAADVLEMITPHVKAGVTTNELNTLCADYTEKVQNAISAPLNYHNFPKSICTSVNNVICHGIPGDKVLKDGDIVIYESTVFPGATEEVCVPILEKLSGLTFNEGFFAQINFTAIFEV